MRKLLLLLKLTSPRDWVEFTSEALAITAMAITVLAAYIVLAY